MVSPMLQRTREVLPLVLLSVIHVVSPQGQFLPVLDVFLSEHPIFSGISNKHPGISTTTQAPTSQLHSRSSQELLVRNLNSATCSLAFAIFKNLGSSFYDPVTLGFHVPKRPIQCRQGIQFFYWMEMEPSSLGRQVHQALCAFVTRPGKSFPRWPCQNRMPHRFSWLEHFLFKWKTFK